MSGRAFDRARASLEELRNSTQITFDYEVLARRLRFLDFFSSWGYLRPEDVDHHLGLDRALD